MPTFKDITDDRELCDQYWEAVRQQAIADPGSIAKAFSVLPVMIDGKLAGVRAISVGRLSHVQGRDTSRRGYTAGNV